MKFLIILSVLFLSACATNPGISKFPDVPTKLMTTPAQLVTIQRDSLETISLDDSSPSTVQLSDLLKVITENYKISNQYREQILGLQLWISTQRAINQ